MVAGLTVHWHTDLAEIDAMQWDALTEGVEGGGPFLRLAFLRAMVDSGSACPDSGWHPLLLTVQDGQGRILAGSPLFVKEHSYGEYVFDWAWADAHDRALASQGAQYYPKLLSASPFSPIPGQRLLVRPDMPADTQVALRAQLLGAIEARCVAQGWSSAHALFVSEPEAQLAERAGWLRRSGVQFHWENRAEAPYIDFEDFLASLQRDKRKKIQRERRKVREAGIEFVIRQGAELTQCYPAILDQQLRQVDTGHFTLDQGSHCAFGFHIRQVVMAIETRAGQGDEQLPGADTAAIDADAGERGVATDVLTLQCCGQLAE